MRQLRAAFLGVSLVALRAPLAAAWVSAPWHPSSSTDVRKTVAEASTFRPVSPMQQESIEEAEISSATPTWARALLASLAVLAAVSFGGSRPAFAEESVNMYFGQGCFWHVQHDLVKKEVSSLKRAPEEITALAGYAGGNEVGKGGNVCYHNMAMAPDYGRMGHTEVVDVVIPTSEVGDFAKFYLDSASKYPFGRADPQDRGGEYRSAIGLPGGVDSPLYKTIQDANAGRMELVAGKGNDDDTVGSKKVYIYDSNKYPFYQGEVYHQFHDDMLERYNKGYHDLKGVALKIGSLKKVDCPEFGM